MRRTETPEPIWIKFCVMVDITDVVTHTNFGDHREHCRISPPSFLAECCKRQLNQGSFVLLYFSLFTFSDLH